MNRIAKQFVPPILLRAYRWVTCPRILQQPEFRPISGPFETWQDAVASSSGYSSEDILVKTRDSMLKVKNGEAAYERDSVIFDKVRHSWPLLAGLMWVAARNQGVLNVLDFGGSLGSTYFQNREFMSQLRSVRWNIVEQSEHVRVGKELFANNEISFFATIQDCLACTTPNVAVLSGVLPYLPQPYSVLNDLLRMPNTTVIIDRTPFVLGDVDRLYVQNVNKTIFDASFPMWVFAYKSFVNKLGENGRGMTEFRDEIENGLFGFSWFGFIVDKK